MKPFLFHLHAISALHCGTGQGIGTVDLPIARAKATNLPIAPGSSLRGVLRDDISNSEDYKHLENALFGPRSVQNHADSHAGALAVGDAHLLVLPVRALAGIICYVSCPFVLNKYATDLKRCGIKSLPNVPAPLEEDAIVPSVNVNAVSKKVVLEDLDLNEKISESAKEWAKLIAQHVYADDNQESDFIKRFAIVSDSVFAYLAETATEIRARIAMDPNTGTVKKGALWYEENLPAETLMWGVYAVSDSLSPTQATSAAELVKPLRQERLIQLGGKSGVGRGLTRFLSA